MKKSYKTIGIIAGILVIGIYAIRKITGYAQIGKMFSGKWGKKNV